MPQRQSLRNLLKNPVVRFVRCSRGKSSNLLLDTLLLLLLGQLGGLVLLAFGLPVLLVLLLTLILVLLEWVFSDSSVSFSVQLFQTISLDVVLNVLGELRLVALLVIVGKSLHVLSNVTTKDVLAQSVGIELLAFWVVARETLLIVGDEDTAVRSTLHGTKDTSTSRGSVETHVEEALEWATLFTVNLGGLGKLVFTICFFDTGEGLVEVEFLEGTASEQETGSVGSRPVGQTVLDSISLELVRIGSAENLVAREFGSHQLADDVSVGETDDEAVFGSVVLVLGLSNQSLTGIVIGLERMSVAEG